MTKAGNSNEPTESSRDYASPPCLMHLVDPASGDLVIDADAQQRTDVVRWRKAERERLIAARLAIPGDERRACSQRIAEWLDAALGDIAGRIVSAYWPICGEPDLRLWMESLVERGGTSALPVVVQRHAPLTFRRWLRGETLEPGGLSIPVPSNGAVVTPDISSSRLSSASIQPAFGWGMAVAFSIGPSPPCRGGRASSAWATRSRKSERSSRRRTMSRWT